MRHNIKLINPKTNESLKQSEIMGFDMVLDSSHNSLWVVSNHIYRLDSRDLKTLVKVDLPIAWTTVSVDYAANGSAWVLERKHSDVKESLDRLINISLEGKVTS